MWLQILGIYSNSRGYHSTPANVLDYTHTQRKNSIPLLRIFSGSEESRTEEHSPFMSPTKHSSHCTGGEKTLSFTNPVNISHGNSWEYSIHANMQKRNLKSPIFLEKPNLVKGSILPHGVSALHPCQSNFQIISFCSCSHDLNKKHILR
jgi:hypothetical protein